MTIALSGITAWSGYPSYNLSVCFADSSPSRGASGEEGKPFEMPRPPLVRSNNDDRRQWRKQGVAVGAAASKTQAKRCGCWVPQPGQWHGEAVTERLNHLKQEKLQIVRLRHAPEDGVVGGLLAHFDLAQLAVSVLRGGAQHLDE